MINEFISTLSKLMHSSHIDVSYFAAGIVAHLASCDNEEWKADCIDKNTLMGDLVSSVKPATFYGQWTDSHIL